MARELSIFVDESGDRGGKARYNMKELDEDEKSFEKLGITFEEKAFCDILVKVRNEHGFPYEEEKYLVLAKAIKEPVDDKAQYADWSTRDNIKNQLNMDLTVLLYKNGYPQERDEEVSEKVLEQTENLKAESNCSFEAMKWSKQATSDLQRRTA